jgi:hypothetical protein
LIDVFSGATHDLSSSMVFHNGERFKGGMEVVLARSSALCVEAHTARRSVSRVHLPADSSRQLD